MATEAQLIGAVLDVLGAPAGSGQGYYADDIAKVQPFLQDVLDDLALRRIIYAADADSVPPGALQWVAALIANAPALVGFYKPSGLPSVDLANSMLRSQRGPFEYRPVRVAYF